MAGRPQGNGMTKLALELGPLIVFFVVNFRAASWGFAELAPFRGVDPTLVPMMASTAAFMLATVVALGVSFALYRRVPIMPLVSGAVVLLFGAATLYLEDQRFIQMKPTIVNLLFAVALFLGLLFRKPLLATVFDSVLELDEAGWRKLTLRWALFFLFLAALNEVVWRTVDYDTWVWFKVFGTLPLTVVFTLFQVPLIQRHEIKRDPTATT
jgi:intracellular septation protein